MRPLTAFSLPSVQRGEGSRDRDAICLGHHADDGSYCRAPPSWNGIAEAPQSTLERKVSALTEQQPHANQLGVLAVGCGALSPSAGQEAEASAVS